ncbi:MAG: hypothetical protein O7D91_04990, partial [Planctomycetota bacterium]|nr:hypothetical protein [Planctomycetota bacterium]
GSSGWICSHSSSLNHCRAIGLSSMIVPMAQISSSNAVQLQGFAIAPYGGVSLAHDLAMRLELDRDINRSVKLLKIKRYVRSATVLYMQIGFLRRLGVKGIPAGLSKREASRAIDEAQQAELKAAA